MNTFDFVLLDCPPSLGILMTNALAAADELLTPIQCEYFALEGLVKIDRVIEQVRNSGANDRLEIGGIVMTMFDSRTNLSPQVVADVREHFGERVYETVIPRTVRLSEAPSFGKSILEYDPNGTGARAYRALAAEFIQRHQAYGTARAISRSGDSENDCGKTAEDGFLLGSHSIFLGDAAGSDVVRMDERNHVRKLAGHRRRDRGRRAPLRWRDPGPNRKDQRGKRSPVLPRHPRFGERSRSSRSIFGSSGG